jgi:serine/threonine-protein kinase HipA
MTDSALVALLSDRQIGVVSRNRRGRLMFIYREQWRADRNAVPLSLSMPLAAAEHPHKRIDPFLWGLLPDNELVLERWARHFRVSARNPFALLSHVGEDCAGAVQFVGPERLELLRSPRAPEVQWLDEAGIADRLRALRADHAAWRSPGDAGQFSLAGAQPKTALLYDEGRWGVPSGRMPTTHILKPPSAELDGHAENEHFCLALARDIGLPAAATEVRRFGEEVAIVVERYDRARTSALAAAAAAESAALAARVDDPTATVKAAAAASRAAALAGLAKVQPVLRLHQEDMCQALGLFPTSKYQSEGGPSPQDIIALLRTHSSRPAEDVGTFVDALAFNWLVAGTDAHAKNYSVLHGGNGHVRLAPLYDIASALPYGQLHLQRLALAMKVGGKYRVHRIGPHEWQKLATDVRLSADETIGRIADLASRVVDSIPTVRDRAVSRGLTHPIVPRLAEALASRAHQCLQLLRA